MTIHLAPKVVGVVAMIGSVATFACTSDADRQTADVEAGGETGTDVADIMQACEAFTLEIARQVLGESARQSEVSEPFTGSTDDIAGSTCTYEADAPTPRSQFATTITGSVLLRGARTELGERSNRVTFEDVRSEFQQAGEPAESVEGVGDAAYYIAGVTNQLHVLLGDGRVSVDRERDGSRRRQQARHGAAGEIDRPESVGTKARRIRSASMVAQPDVRRGNAGGPGLGSLVRLYRARDIPGGSRDRLPAPSRVVRGTGNGRAISDGMVRLRKPGATLGVAGSVRALPRRDCV